MVYFFNLVSFLSLGLFVSAVPSQLERRLDTATYCDQWRNVTQGSYSLLLDQWGASGGSGQSCAGLTAASGTTIAWKNTWTWTSGTGGVKSYTNVDLNVGLNKQLSAIKTIQSTFKWSQTTSGSIVANVAFDLFTSSTVGGSNVNEIMIWLGTFGAGPISATYNSDGTPKPAKSSISVAGYTWNLYSGSNGANNVYSFIPSNGASVTSFTADLNLFLKYLTANLGVSTSQYLKTVQVGTEATSGSATLTVSSYSAVIA